MSKLDFNILFIITKTQTRPDKSPSKSMCLGKETALLTSDCSD